MAGETRGELAEAIAKVAVQDAAAAVLPGDQVFWEEIPDDAVIKPDITVGSSKNSPHAVFLVNASDSPKESDKKFWRNIGEIFDAKSRLTPRPRVCVLVFKSEIKPELIKLTAAICDSVHLVDRDPTHGAAILKWLEANHANAPSKREDKEALVRSTIRKSSRVFDPEFSGALKSLSTTIGRILRVSRPELEPLWELVTKDYASRVAKPVRSSRTTLLRRGLTRWLVFDSSTLERALSCLYRSRAVPSSQVPAYARLLGMLRPTLGGGVIPADSGGGNDMFSTTGIDLRLAADFFRNAARGDAKVAQQALFAALTGVPEEMSRTASRLRAVPDRVAAWHSYVVANWEKIRSPQGCFRALRACGSDSTFEGRVPPSEGNWLYDHLIAILRAHSGKNNDFGYGTLVGHFKSCREKATFRKMMQEVLADLTGNQARAAERWIRETLQHSAEPGRRGFQDWLAGTKDVNPVIIAAFAYSLAEKLVAVRNPAKIDPSALVAAHAYSLWNKLLTYQDFEPLPALVEAAGGSRVRRVSARTVMADLAERAVQDAGNMPALAFDGGLVCWKSAHGSHTSDKRKELSGRARALRFERDGKGFKIRREAERLMLVLDGTFDDSDIRVLSESGWDRIFYPDEMNELVEAIA